MSNTNYTIMKKYITAIIIGFLSFGMLTNAQIRTNNTISQTIAGESAFIDASSSVFSGTSNNQNGKGLVFPRTNLTTFTFAKPNGTIASFPTAYDGMIVYNTATGVTPATGSGTGGQNVTPGFYYFSNPGIGSAVTGGNNSYTSSTGRWLPIGGTPVNPKVNASNTESVTNLQIAGADVYIKKGSFRTDGASTSPIAYTDKIVLGTSGTASMYRITVFKAGKVFANSVYSFDNASGDIVTGSPSMSVVYPEDLYDYTVEYLK